MKKKHCQGIGKVYQFDKKEDDETINNDDKKLTLEKYNTSNLIYSKYSFLVNFFNGFR